MQTAPIVFNDAQAELHAGAQKRNSRDQLSPVGHTPNSAERKPKERRKRTIDTPNHNLASTYASTGGPSDIVVEIEAMNCADAEREEEAFVTADSTQTTTQVPAETNIAQVEHHMSTMEQEASK